MKESVLKKSTNPHGFSSMNQTTEPSFDHDLLGRLRRELFWTIGEVRAHGVLARLGLSIGQRDGISMSGTSTFRMMRTLSDHLKIRSNQEIVVETKNSVEAGAHATFFNEPSKTCQCWFLAGYLSGFLTQRRKRVVYLLETQCMAKGDSCCRFVGRPIHDWGSDQELQLQVYQEDNIVLELSNTREQLRQTKDRYQNLFEHGSIPILIIDPVTGMILDTNINMESLTGYSRKDLLNMTLFDLFLPNLHHKLMIGLKDLQADEKEKDEDITLVRKDGYRRTVAASSKILSYGGERVVQFVMRDITDLKVAEQKEHDLQHQLQRSERLSSMGQLAASVAHEIKNPLGAIRNAIYYITKALENNPLLESDPQLKVILKLAEDEVCGAVAIIEEILDFSRVVHIVPRRTSVNDLLENIPKILTIPPTINLKMDLDITLPSAILDPNRMTQVFVNIVSNAIQAMQNGGRLEVKSRLEIENSDENEKNREMIMVSFEDTGPGIAPHQLTKIFEPLFTTKARGTGLGLAICSNIIQKHGGSIEVASQQGKGTIFTVKIPLQTPLDSEEASHDII